MINGPIDFPLQPSDWQEGKGNGLAATSKPGDRSRGPPRAGPPETHILPVCQRLETEYWESEKVRPP